MKMLRQEILHNQDYQQSLNRWKIVMVSGLSAIGIGLGAKESLVKAYYLLLGVPFVCIYVDLLFYQATLRIFAIANFIRTFCERELNEDDLIIQKYEAFIHNVRNYQIKDIFELGKRAQYWSSIVFTISLPGLGAGLYFQQTQASLAPTFFLYPIIIIVGVFAHIILYREYRRLLGGINHLVSPMVVIIDKKKDGGLPDDMVKMIREIAKFDDRLLRPLCMESLSWSDEDAQKEGKKKLQAIKNNIGIEKER